MTPPVPPLAAIIFDFDGVIADSEPLHYQALLQLGQKHVNVSFDFEFYGKELIGFDDRDGIREIWKMGGKTVESDAQLKALCQEKQEILEAIISSGGKNSVSAIPGTIELIRSVASAGFKLAIGSGATTRDLELMLTALKVREHFGIIVSADHVTKSKPDPETYNKAFAQLSEKYPHITLQNTIVIEDTSAGVEAALKAGLRVLGIATTGPIESLSRATKTAPNLVGIDAAGLQKLFA